VDAGKLTVRDRNRNCRGGGGMNPEVLKRCSLYDYRLGIRSLTGSRLNCCRVGGGVCGYS